MATTDVEDKASPAPAATPVAPTVYSKKYTAWMLFLLAVTYANDYADRSVLRILAQPIKAEMNLSDTQLGLLSGLAFSVFYALFGYPLARLSEKTGRINIITACAVVWSCFTAACGTATNFAQLLFYRFGVGAGESGMAAPSHSLISDYFPPNRRTTAIALFSMGVPVGALAGVIAGGWLAEHYGWRAAFLIISIPGFLLAPLVKLTIKEPIRGNWDASRLAGKPAEKTPPLKEVLKKQFATQTFRAICIGHVLCVFSASGSAFTAAYLVRRFEIPYTTVGFALGLLSAVGIITAFMSGFLTDQLAKWNKRWYCLLPAIAVTVQAVLHFAGYMQSTWQMQLFFMFLAAFCAITSVPFYGMTQNLLPARMRASGAAVIFFLINLIGLGFGPVFFGMVIDQFTNVTFAGYGIGEYVTTCGKGGLLATAEHLPMCKAALAHATRWTLACESFGLLGGAMLFLYASRFAARDLSEAGRTN